MVIFVPTTLERWMNKWDFMHFLWYFVFRWTRSCNPFSISSQQVLHMCTFTFISIEKGSDGTIANNRVFEIGGKYATIENTRHKWISFCLESTWKNLYKLNLQKTSRTTCQLATAISWAIPIIAHGRLKWPTRPPLTPRKTIKVALRQNLRIYLLIMPSPPPSTSMKRLSHSTI